MRGIRGGHLLVYMWSRAWLMSELNSTVKRTSFVFHVAQKENFFWHTRARSPHFYNPKHTRQLHIPHDPTRDVKDISSSYKGIYPHPRGGINKSSASHFGPVRVRSLHFCYLTCSQYGRWTSARPGRCSCGSSAPTTSSSTRSSYKSRPKSSTFTGLNFIWYFVRFSRLLAGFSAAPSRPSSSSLCSLSLVPLPSLYP